MFKVSDVVVYGQQGVCEIVDIETRRVDGELKDFFVLKTKSDQSATYYVPTWNGKALGKMRRVIDRNELDALIDAIPAEKPVWIPDGNARKEAYKKILSSGDQAAIVSMVRALYFHKKQREADGKRLHMSDEQFMKAAEMLLHSEWRYVLNMDEGSLTDYICTRIENR